MGFDPGNIIRGGFARLGRPTNYQLGKIRAVLDAHSKALENFHADGGDEPYPNSEGGWTYQLRNSLSSLYFSYFRVINASTELACKIGVTSGGPTATGICGVVKINGESVDVEAVSEEKSAGSYWVWIHSWISETGPNAEIRITATSTAPANPNGGILYTSQLAGRVVIADGAIVSITQDYLRGGEHAEFLFGDCSGLEIE